MNLDRILIADMLDSSVDVATELDVQYSVSAPHIAKKNARRAAFNYMTLN